jgi:hypothetical protein
MIRGLRAADAAILQRLCGGDTRLFLRLGALLQHHLSITEAALEAALTRPGARALLSDRRLQTIDLAGFNALLSEGDGAGLGLILAGATEGAESGWRVIALDDEVGNPLTPEPESVPVPEAVAATPAGEPALSSLVATLAPALRAPVEGLLSARADDQRAAALEQLRYAMPPLAVVSDLMPLLLADAAELVRERTIGLMVAAGAHVAVVDLVRALQRRDEAAMARAGEALASLSGPQRELSVAAIAASAQRGQITPGLVALCERLAGHLIGYRHLERLLEMLLSTRGISLLALVRALQEHDVELIDSLLRRQFGHGAESDATLVVLLAVPGRHGDDALLSRGVELLLSPEEAPQERMALASALRRLDAGHLPPRLAARIAAHAGDIPQARDTSVHWLIAECCRDGTVTPATAELLAAALRRLLRDSPGPHLVAALDQQLPALIPASDAARGALVEPLVEVVARFRDERTRDLVAQCLIGIGAAAATTLWMLLEEHPHQTVRLLATELLPALLGQAQPSARQLAARRLLAGLERATQGVERGALVTAAAQLARSSEVDAGLSLLVDAAVKGQGDWGIEALGLLAAGAHLSEARRAEIIDQLLAKLGEDLPDASMEQQVDAGTDEVTFLLDDRLGAHTESVPRMLTALGRIGCSLTLPEALLKRLVQRLCSQWLKVSTWQTIWGPGNIQELGRVLGLLAARATFPGPLRVQICEALLPKLNQLVIARSLARVFVNADGPYLSELAGRAADRLVQLATDKYYAEDEWPELVETLVDYLVIPHLGTRAEAVRRRLVNLVSAYRAHCTSRARAKLRALLPDLTKDLQERLDWT